MTRSRMQTSYRSAQTRQDLEQSGIYAINREFATDRQTGCEDQYDQPGHHHDATRQGRTQWAARYGYRRMIEVCAAGRSGTPDEVGTVAAPLMGPDGGFITGSDFLMDGGVTAAYWYGDLAPQ